MPVQEVATQQNPNEHPHCRAGAGMEESAQRCKEGGARTPASRGWLGAQAGSVPTLTCKSCVLTIKPGFVGHAARLGMLKGDS